PGRIAGHHWLLISPLALHTRSKPLKDLLSRLTCRGRIGQDFLKRVGKCSSPSVVSEVFLSFLIILAGGKYQSPKVFRRYRKARSFMNVCFVPRHPARPAVISAPANRAAEAAIGNYRQADVLLNGLQAQPGKLLIADVGSAKIGIGWHQALIVAFWV